MKCERLAVLDLGANCFHNHFKNMCTLANYINFLIYFFKISMYISYRILSVRNQEFYSGFNESIEMFSGSHNSYMFR